MVSPICQLSIVSLFIPDSGFHEPLNKRFTPHVAGHKFPQLLLEDLPARVNRIGLRKVNKDTAGLVIGQARPAFDSLLDRLPLLGKIFRQVFQISLSFLAALDLTPLLFAFFLFNAYLFCRFGISPEFSYRAPGRFGPVSLQTAPPCCKSIFERSFGLLSFAGQKLF